jgi:hypothetical protein
MVGGDQGADHRGIVYWRSVGVGGSAPTRASTPAAVWLAPLCPDGQFGGNGGDPPAFVPMITDGATAPASCAAMAGSAIEIEVAGMIVRVRGRVMEALVEVLAAVKRAR